MMNNNVNTNNGAVETNKEWVEIPFNKFNVILEDGSLMPNCTLRCNKGVIRDRRDLNNALKWEREVKATNQYHSNCPIKNHEIYTIEEAV